MRTPIYSSPVVDHAEAVGEFKRKVRVPRVADELRESTGWAWERLEAHGSSLEEKSSFEACDPGNRLSDAGQAVDEGADFCLEVETT